MEDYDKIREQEKERLKSPVNEGRAKGADTHVFEFVNGKLKRTKVNRVGYYNMNSKKEEKSIEEKRESELERKARYSKNTFEYGKKGDLKYIKTTRFDLYNSNKFKPKPKRGIRINLLKNCYD